MMSTQFGRYNNSYRIVTYGLVINYKTKVMKFVVPPHLCDERVKFNLLLFYNAIVSFRADPKVDVKSLQISATDYDFIRNNPDMSVEDVLDNLLYNNIKVGILRETETKL